MIASSAGNDSIVEMLLSHTRLPLVDVNAQDKVSQILSLCVWCVRVRPVSFTILVPFVLLFARHNFWRNFFLQNGYTALIMACIKDNTDVVRELLRSPHIDVNLQDNVRDWCEVADVYQTYFLSLWACYSLSDSNYIFRSKSELIFCRVDGRRSHGHPIKAMSQ